ncbi:hypothetical protein LA080_000518 [Diaporthe eres]|nr:hypothetical protein LA080_000518 [Diaporthe eres]
MLTALNARFHNRGSTANWLGGSPDQQPFGGSNLLIDLTIDQGFRLCTWISLARHGIFALRRRTTPQLTVRRAKQPPTSSK